MLHQRPRRHWTRGPHGVPSHVRGSRRRRALGGIHHGHDVGLPRGDVHLRQGEPRQEQRDRAGQRGSERHRCQQQVRGEVGEHHHVQQPDAGRDPHCDERRGRLQHTGSEEDRPHQLGPRAELAMEPEHQERLHHEPAAERVHGEQA